MLKLILIAGALQGTLLGLVLMSRKSNPKANRIFSVLLFLLSIHIVVVAFDEREFFIRFPHLSHLTWLIPLLYGPLILLYVRRITLISPTFQLQELLYFIPFLVWLAIQLPYYLQPASYKLAYLDNYELSVKDDFGLLNQLTNFVHLFFFSLCIHVYHKHEARILHYYSDLKKVRMVWLRQFLYEALIIIIISIFVFYARKYEWPYVSKLYPFHFLGIVILIYWTGYKAMAQPALFGSDQMGQPEITENIAQNTVQENVIVTANSNPEKTTKRSTLDEATLEILALQLKEVMDTEKLYLNSELTIQDLTKKLQTNRHLAAA